MKAREIANMMIAGILLLTAASAAPAQEVTLYNFKGSGSSDGSVPECNLIMDAAGNIYGTTNSGGAVGAPFDTYGTVFEVSPGAGGTWTEKVLYSFGANASDGIQPLGGLVFDANGNLYGTTSLGGAHNGGTVFELSPGAGGVWTETVLYSFGASTTDGSNPRRGSLIFDSKGNLYGTTMLGGEWTTGTVFELSPGTGGVWTETVLYSFGTIGLDGANSVAGLIFDPAGNLYGTTKYGGQYSQGTAFELSPGAGGIWTETVLHSFDDNGTDGSIPEAGLVIDAAGNLYGTTYGGGSNPYSGGLGAVFELSPAGGGTWSEQVIYSFNAAVGIGDYPLGGLAIDSGGNLYGTASSGLYAFGQVFKLAPSSAGWTETTLYYFGDTPDGYAPDNGVVFDSQGNLYGTTSTGGTEAADLGLGGTVYEIPNVVTPNPKFTPGEGAYAGSQLVTISDAVTTATINYSINGGSYTKYSGQIDVSESETIQAIAIAGALPPSQTVTASYQIGTTAAAPVFSPPQGAYSVPQSVTLSTAAPGATIYYTTDGILPTTSSMKYTGPIPVSSTETIEAFAAAPGYTDSPVVTSIYDIAPVTLPQVEVLYTFNLTNALADGQEPTDDVIFDAQGNLYGTTSAGGSSENGLSFELTPTASGPWTESVLYTFATNANDGLNPVAGLVFDTVGNLYGTTPSGGTYGMGTVFELSPATGGAWTEKVIYNFGSIINDGIQPEAGLIFDTKGNLYGTTYGGGAYSSNGVNPGGTVFELSPAAGGAWTETLPHSFDYLNTSDGYYPTASLIFDTKGNLYGTTTDGGAGQDGQGGGTVFELSPAAGGVWTENVLHNFAGCAEFCSDGYTPKSGLTIDAAGNLYGTTSAGGPNGFGADGMVFELSPSTGGTWTETVLHNFGAYESDGVNPYAGLVLDEQGNLYGTTIGGGANGYGTVFELTPEAIGGWLERVLLSCGDNSGDHPQGGLTLDAAANLYGTTRVGGAAALFGVGTVFEIASGITVNPNFTPPAGTYAAIQMVALTDATPGATIYYTTNGDTPTTSSTKYTAKINVASSETIKAIAVSTGLPPSSVATATYQIFIPAALTSPTPGSTLTGTSATFTWTAGTGVTTYQFRLGTTGAGSTDVYNSAKADTNALTTGLVTNIPNTGQTLYARLYSYINGAWQYNDYTYKEFEAGAKGVLTSPTPGSTLTGSSATFTWTAGTGVTKYQFRLGTTGAGSSNIYNPSNASTTALTTGLVTNIPGNGQTLYARLYSYIDGAWQYNDYTYTEAAGLPGVLTSPTPGSTLTGSSATFTWSAGTNVTKYQFRVGTTGAGSSNIYNPSNASTTALTTGLVSNIPTAGQTLYARLYSYIDGAWQYNDYTYTEASGAPGVLTSPTPGGTLTGSSATFTWTAGTNVTKYQFRVGTTGAGSSNIYNPSDLSTTTLTTGLVTNIPTTGQTLYARLYSYIDGAWQYHDYTYTEAQ